MPFDPLPYRTLRRGVTFNFRGFDPSSAVAGTADEVVDVDLVVPSLNLDALETLQSRLQTLTAEPSAASMQTLVEALSLALARNYRNVPRWLISQTIDVANMADMMMAVMDVSGLKRKESEAEKKAVTAPLNGAAPMTGTNSTVS